jgi:ketol-acid reductoisomerase
LKQADLDHPIEAVGKKLRAKMVWLANARSTRYSQAGRDRMNANPQATAA